MSPATFWIAFAGFLCLCWLLWGGGIRLWGRRQMRTLAKETGLEWSRAKGSGLPAALGQLTGEYDGHAVEVRHFNERFGFLSGPMLQIILPISNPQEWTLHVAEARGVGAIGRQLGMPLVETGDAAFDSDLLVKSRHPQIARQILNDTVRHALHEAWDLRGATGSLKLEPRRIYYEEPAALYSGAARRRVISLLQASSGIARALQTIESEG